MYPVETYWTDLLDYCKVRGLFAEFEGDAAFGSPVFFSLEGTPEMSVIFVGTAASDSPQTVCKISPDSGYLGCPILLTAGSQVMLGAALGWLNILSWSFM